MISFHERICYKKKSNVWGKLLFLNWKYILVYMSYSYGFEDAQVCLLLKQVFMSVRFERGRTRARNMEYAVSHYRILIFKSSWTCHLTCSNYAFRMICLDKINKINAARVHNLGRK